MNDDDNDDNNDDDNDGGIARVTSHESTEHEQLELRFTQGENFRNLLTSLTNIS